MNFIRPVTLFLQNIVRKIAARIDGTPFSRRAVYINTGLHVPLRGETTFPCDR